METLGNGHPIELQTLPKSLPSNSDVCSDSAPKKRRRNNPFVRIARGLWRYGPTGNIFWCHKLNGRNVWTNLQTTDRKRAMATSTLMEYAGCPNGHTEIFAWPGTGSPGLAGAAQPMPLPVATPEPAPAAKFAPEASGPAAATAQPSIPTTTIHSGHSLHSLVEKFRAGSGHLSASTREKFDSHFNVLARYLNFDLEVTSIKLADMRELKSKLSEGRKPSSVNDILFKALSALFQIAVEDGILTESPLAKLKRAKKGETERQQPTWEQAERIVAEVATKARESSLIVNLMRNFGVGQAEIEQLRGEHFDLAKGLVHFRRKKTGKFFDVPIFPHSKALVEELKNKGRLGVGRPVVEWREPRAALAAACRRLEFPVYGPRGLRRCFIIHALEIGVDPRVVARWQGHKDATLILKVYGKYIDPAHELRQAQKMVTGAGASAVISTAETDMGSAKPS